MYIVFLRIHPRLCAASAFKLFAVKCLQEQLKIILLGKDAELNHIKNQQNL
jgi:hypothetical protein